MKALFKKIKNGLNKAKEIVADAFADDNGVGVIEVVLILVVLIAIVLIFKTQIMSIVNGAFQAITRDSGNIIS